MDKYERIVREIEAQMEQSWVYMMGGIERPENIKDTAAYRFGWNDGQEEFAESIEKCMRQKEDYALTDYFLFHIDDFWKDGDDWYIQLSDTWYYATADGEYVPEEHYEDVIKMHRAYGRAGLLWWVWKKYRSESLPKIPRYQRMIEAVDVLLDRLSTGC